MFVIIVLFYVIMNYFESVTGNGISSVPVGRLDVMYVFTST